MPNVETDHLRSLIERLFIAAKTPAATAGALAGEILDNCLFGHDTHGMMLVPRFLGHIESGKIEPKAAIEITRKTGATAIIDAHRGFGNLALKDAMRTAMSIAAEFGVSAVAMTNCNHVGMLWSTAKMPAEKGMVGMIWAVAGPEGGGGLVAPFGGKKRAIGANPIGVGIPAGEMKPLVLDISTSAAAGGKVFLYAEQGKKIPLGWLIDEDGRPTDDPNEFMKDGRWCGALLPMAGYKGFGLGLIAEILGGILTGFGANHMIPGYVEGNGVFIVVVDVGKFLLPEKFTEEVDAFLTYVKSIPTDEKTDEILIPGEVEFDTRKKREQEGRIPVTDKIWNDIREWAQKLGVDMGNPE
jgi:uncharacterized oxidoreductase